MSSNPKHGDGRTLKRINLTLLCVGVSLSTACVRGPSNPQMTGRATDIPATFATSEFWYQQPATQSVEALSFDRLWNAANDAIRARMFTVDRTDYRAGILTTQPMSSSQFFEPWRRDNMRAYDVAESSLATIRRTLRFEISRTEAGTYRLEPKVLVERFALAEARVTSVQLFRDSIGGPRPSGTVESDRGQIIPQSYWYALGRDQKLEKELRDAVQSRLN